MIVRLIGAAMTAAALTATANDHPTNDYPTVDRVLFVEVCIRDHPDRGRQEMIYKCSCAVDALAEQLSYDDFVELSTAFFAGQAAGERGTRIRESAEGREFATRFRDAQKHAYEKCLIQ